METFEPMVKRLPPLNPLRAFEAAARHGSLTRAAGERTAGVLIARLHEGVAADQPDAFPQPDLATQLHAPGAGAFDIVVAKLLNSLGIHLGAVSIDLDEIAQLVVEETQFQPQPAFWWKSMVPSASRSTSGNGFWGRAQASGKQSAQK